MTSSTLSSTDSAVTPLLRAANRLRRSINSDVERATALPGLWFEALLWISRSTDGATRMCDLAETIEIPPSSCTRLIDQMEAAQLVTRSMDPGNRRNVLVRLTEQGAARLESALEAHAASIDRHFSSRLSPSEIELLSEVAARLSDEAPGELAP